MQISHAEFDFTWALYQASIFQTLSRTVPGSPLYLPQDADLKRDHGNRPSKRVEWKSRVTGYP